MALAQADVNIAMGKGSDIAMDVAKMTIISSELTKITEAIRLSRSTVTTIKQNPLSSVKCGKQQPKIEMEKVSICKSYKSIPKPTSTMWREPDLRFNY